MSHSFKIRYGESHFTVLFFLLGLIYMLTSCKESIRPYSIAEFTGNVEVYNFSRSLNRLSHYSDSINPAALLTGNGDLIVYHDQFLCFSNSTENKFQLQIINGDGYVNGKINSLNFKARKDMIPWFKEMKSKDLSSLDFIKLDSLIPESYYPYMDELAHLKPGIGLFYEGELTDISKLIKIFNPGNIIGGSISGKDFNLLSGLTNLKMLMITLTDSINDIPLPNMPQLNQLILTDSEKKTKIGESFLSENQHLERLAFMEINKLDLAVIKSLKNLKELIVGDFDTILNPDILKDEKHLELLSIAGRNFKYNQILNELPGIRWMTFSSEATQADFDSFMQYHPDLEVVEIIKNDTIKSFQQLAKLNKIYGLSITDTVTDVATVKSMKNLKYLSLPDKVLKKAGKRNDLQKALPGTKIDANEGLCLGSGWIILIIPFMMLAIGFSRKRIRRAEKPV